MKISTLFLLVSTLLMTMTGSTAMACTGIPDLNLSIVQQTFEGLATLLVMPDGSGPPLTEAHTADGTVVDATIHLTLISTCIEAEPVPNFPREDMWLVSLGGGLAMCQGGTIADSNTDVDGHTQWSLPLKAGGWDDGNSRVVVNGVELGDPAGLTVNFSSPDIDGNLVVNLSDVTLFAMDFFGPYVFRSDLHHDGAVNLSDLAVVAGAVGITCP
ncbi:MAG: hypothetical protein ABFS42_09005 [Candidatus Krumholzibacteriota bacterium]